MKIAIIGGTGAMGSIFGGRLMQAGHDVTLLDVAEASVNRINQEGLRITDKQNQTDIIRVKATTRPADIVSSDLAIVFVKCFHTEAAMKNAAPYLGTGTDVLSLQNGWGNAQVISEVIGRERLLIGVNYVSGTVLEPGHVRQVGNPVAFVGAWGAPADDRVKKVVDTLSQAGFQTTASDNALLDVWKKLALNVCTLPTAALLGFQAHQLIAHTGTLDLMKALLGEVVAVAQAQRIPLNYTERWDYIVKLLQNAVGARGSMLQDVEGRGRTEIDVINGAIVAAGQASGIPTPYNQSMVWAIKALEESYLEG